MIHDFVARVGQRLDGFRVFLRPVPDNEEGRMGLVFVQNVDQHLRILVSPCGVKRDRRHLVFPLHRINRQLPF